MRNPLSAPNGRRLALAIAAAGLAFAAAPALAQTVDEVTVYGHLGPDGRPNTLSRAVDIADLDLRSDADVREMQKRVRYTARALCDELGETGGPGLTPSCVDAAVRNAQRQTRFAVAQARAPVYYAYVAPPPYADDYAPPASAVVRDYPPEP
jgi:UrcA family protein